MARVQIEIDGRKDWVDAYKKDNHWYFEDTNTLIKPEIIHDVKD
jgi:hypothetical protein